MKKIKTPLLLFVIALTGCIDYTKRLDTAQKKFPTMVITPATGLIARQGYEFLAEDTANNQIYAISFGPFSETRIETVRNIK